MHSPGWDLPVTYNRCMNAWVWQWLFICWVVNNDDLLSYFCSDKSEPNTQLATIHFVTEMIPDVIGVISDKYEFVTLISWVAIGFWGTKHFVS